MRIWLMAGAAAAAISSCGREKSETEPVTAPASAQSTVAAHGLELAARTFDAARGRELFVIKGCVVCHSVNGVGGKAAPALDVEIGVSSIDPLDFSARMWRGAPAMVELQSVELGYPIDLTGDDIGDLAAFASDRAEQRLLTLETVPEPMRDSLLDERFWEVEEWDEFLRNGQEGAGEPEAPAEKEEAPPSGPIDL